MHLSNILQCAVPVILSAGTPVSGPEDTINAGCDGEQYLIVHLSDIFQCAVPVILSAGMPVSGPEDRINAGRDGEQYLMEVT